MTKTGNIIGVPFQKYQYQNTDSYILDKIPGIVAAYSLRKLKSDATLCIRLRRDSDDAEQDIVYVDGILDTATLLTFCGAGNGYITTWYDQSGNTGNLIQTTGSKQPQIVSNGVVLTKNGKPAPYFNSANGTYLDALSSWNVSTNNLMIFVVASYDEKGYYPKLLNTWKTGESYNGAGSTVWYRHPDTGNISVTKGEYGTDTHAATMPLSQLHVTSLLSADTYFNVQTDSAISSNTANTTPVTFDNVRLGARDYGGEPLLGSIPEFIAVSNNSITDRTAIHESIKDFYETAA